MSDYDTEVIELSDDEYDSFSVFQNMATQWRTGFNGPVGLDYNVMPMIMDLVEVQDRKLVLIDIKIMENATLKLFERMRNEK